MADAVSNTSPLLYLHRLGIVEWLPELFDNTLTPDAVWNELAEGEKLGYNVPQHQLYQWLMIKNPKSLPPKWVSLDLGAGELAAMALALEHPDHILLLDDLLARRVAQTAGLTVWGTLRVILEGKSAGLIKHVAPLLNEAERAGLWMSEKIRRRVLKLANEQ